MKHRLKDHKQYVPVCKNNLDGCCIYGANKCWFKHEDTIENEESPEMEKFTEKMELLESQFYN